jgi:hypothetical protein
VAITSAVVNSFRRDALQGIHLASHVYKMALYLAASASLSTTTTAYTTTGEITGSGYSAGGIVLTGYLVQVLTNVACLDWTDPVWDPSTITADGFLIYNNTLAGKDAVMTYNFGAPYTSTNGPFTANLPTPGAATSLIQWA